MESTRHFKKLRIIAISALVLPLPLTTNSQIIIGPGSCPPGQVFQPPNSCVPAPSPSPTPSPEPSVDPIVLIPGIVASLNVNTTILDQNTGTWNFNPAAVSLYNGLLERLQTKGYTLNDNLFIAHYHWRQPNSESVNEYLIPTIEEAKQATGAEKVDIIAHSMGGLIARDYIQGTSYQNDVDQLILLGTPNQGASDAYIVWEGGQYPRRWSTSFIVYITFIESILTSVNFTPFLVEPESIRTYFPSLKDLIPTYDFAIRENGIPAIPATLTDPNNYLSGLAGTTHRLADRGVNVTTIAGNQSDTLNQFSVPENRNIEDIILNRWRDGHPAPDPPIADTQAGDRTVLLTSSHLSEHDNITLDGVAHDDLPEDAQEEVLTVLGLDPSGDHIAYANPDSFLGLGILSPIDPKLTCASGEELSKDENTFSDAGYFETEGDPNGPKLLIIADPPESECSLTLTGTDTGDYTVITTYADEDEVISTTKQGTTEPGKIEKASFLINDESFTAPPTDLCSTIDDLTTTLRDLRQDNQLDRRSFIRLFLPAARSHFSCRIYERLSARHGLDSQPAQRLYQHTQQNIDRFHRHLDRLIEQEKLNETTLTTLAPHLQAITDAGL